jgi:hypothetical protein
LWAITLTNIPALEGELPQLQEQIKLTKGEKLKNMTLESRMIALNTKKSTIALTGESSKLMYDEAFVNEVFGGTGEPLLKDLNISGIFNCRINILKWFANSRYAFF